LNLEVKNISKSYGSFYAVKDFSFTFSKGVCGLIGPNGSGKTTLMRMLANVLSPTDGKILFSNKDIAVLGEGYRDVLGYLPQEFEMYGNFSAEKFLHFIAALKGVSPKEVQKKSDELLELANLKDVKKKKIGTFSGGMKQRLGVAQAIINDPKVLILDEPTAGLDPNERIRFRNLITEISGDRIVLLSTHIVSDVESIAEQVVLIKNGSIIKSGSPGALISKLEGRVWVASILDSELEKTKKLYRVGGINRQNDKLEIRIISDKKPLLGAVLAKPTLEELYLDNFDIEEKE